MKATRITPTSDWTQPQRRDPKVFSYNEPSDIARRDFIDDSAASIRADFPSISVRDSYNVAEHALSFDEWLVRYQPKTSTPAPRTGEPQPAVQKCGSRQTATVPSAARR